ncbi:BnaC06g29940D [Brassica napus]|uniref:(rape) hypothetical protein n=1 Tax=Brassica napus TaxID=3708 RepID=A0A078H9R4_BRANA|nr:unnamed protein product [Brassica napus]CDY33558.1 BnaC06g29940D [Brassica napus]
MQNHCTNCYKLQLTSLESTCDMSNQELATTSNDHNPQDLYG